MNEDKLYSECSILPLTTSLLLASQRQNKNMTPEEREARERRLEFAQAVLEHQRKELIIRQLKCPSCQGKLTRGKKNKKMNYHRSWVCSSCDEEHYA